MVLVDVALVCPAGLQRCHFERGESRNFPNRISRYAEWRALSTCDGCANDHSPAVE